MLRTLRIRDFVIVDELVVDFGPGLNLLTGETGAGKSIVVDALGWIAGGRADRGLVRAGADRAQVEALFELAANDVVRAWLDERGLASSERADDHQLVLRREVVAAGGGRAWINGSPCTVSMLAELGAMLLELHGQHEFRGLLSRERHLAVLDQFADCASELARVADGHAQVLAARTRRDELHASAARRAERAQELETFLRELEAVRPRVGELDELDRERRLLRNAAGVSESLDEVVGLTHEGDSTAATLAATAARRLERLAELDERLREAAERLREAAVEVDDVGAYLRDYRERLDFDPQRLETIEARRVALERLYLRHGLDEAALPERLAAAEQELESLRGLDESLARADAEVDAAEAAYVAAAVDLGRARRRAARRLAAEVEAQLGALALGQARFEVGFSAAAGERVRAERREIALSRRGAERVEFRLTANPGEPAGPLQKVASGGELSRLMLALHAASGGDGAGPRALVFDEVDAGIGGAVADAVGARLARLARRHQVLCVTHLPQVAAYADRHFSVRKRVAAGRTHAEVRGLDERQRVAELARMLGGRRATAASRRHASELLNAASRAARSVGQP